MCFSEFEHNGNVQNLQIPREDNEKLKQERKIKVDGVGIKVMKHKGHILPGKQH